jgi:hypothetical protein
MNTDPNLDSCSGDLVFSENSGSGSRSRIFAIGGSHVMRIVGRLAECSVDVVYLAKPGWILNALTANECKQKLHTANILQSDNFN